MRHPALRFRICTDIAAHRLGYDLWPRQGQWCNIVYCASSLQYSTVALSSTSPFDKSVELCKQLQFEKHCPHSAIREVLLGERQDLLEGGLHVGELVLQIRDALLQLGLLDLLFIAPDASVLIQITRSPTLALVTKSDAEESDELPESDSSAESHSLGSS
jgi:hypothetical protein